MYEPWAAAAAAAAATTTTRPVACMNRYAMILRGIRLIFV